MYKRQAQTSSICLYLDLWFKIIHKTLHVDTARDKPATLEASPNKRSIGPVGFAGSVEREVVEVPGAKWGGGEVKGLERRGLRDEMLERGLAAPHRRTSTIPHLASAKVTLHTPTRLR